MAEGRQQSETERRAARRAAGAIPGPALRFPLSIVLPGLVAAVSAALVLRATPGPWWQRLALIAAGVLLWTLVEYLLHRVLLHRVGPFERWHQDHHLRPEQPIRVPLLFSVPLLVMLAGLPLLLFGSAAAAAPLVLGLVGGHILQESVHDRLHRGPASPESWLERRRLAHRFHHLDDESVEFGTLTGFWDRAFGSLRRR